MGLGFTLLVFSNALLSPPIGSTDIVPVLLLSLLCIAVYGGIYLLTMKKVARRDTPELALRHAGRETLLGIGTGLAFITLCVLTISALSGYSFRWAPAESAGVIFAGLVLFASAALFEEMIFRGLFVQGIERLGGSGVALACTSVFFGAAHLANPSATWVSALAIAIEAGLLLGAAFLWRRNLWFVTGLHWVWNSSVSLLGIPVSGIDSSGLFEVDVHGSDLLTGGDFGIEGSMVPVVFGLLLAGWMWVRARQSGKLVPLHGRRKRAENK